PCAEGMPGSTAATRERKLAGAQGSYHEAPPLVGCVRLIVTPAAQRDQPILRRSRTDTPILDDCSLAATWLILAHRNHCISMEKPGGLEGPFEEATGWG